MRWDNLIYTAEKNILPIKKPRDGEAVCITQCRLARRHIALRNGIFYRYNLGVVRYCAIYLSAC